MSAAPQVTPAYVLGSPVPRFNTVDEARKARRALEKLVADVTAIERGNLRLHGRGRVRVKQRARLAIEAVVELCTQHAAAAAVLGEAP